MEFAELKVERRSRTGKGGARECRRNGMLPGIIYGKEEESIPIAVNPKDLDKVLHTATGGNVIIKLSLDENGGTPVNVIVKELQVDNIKGMMKHIDFCHVLLDEKIRSMIPFRVVGESPGVKLGGILEHLLWDLEVESLPLDIPDEIEFDVSDLDIGDSLTVSQLTVPEKTSIITDENTKIVHVVAPRVEVEEEVEEVEIEGEEPEVISGEGEKEPTEAESETKPKASEGKQEPQDKRKAKK